MPPTGRGREPRHLGPAGLGRQAAPPDRPPGRRLVPFVLSRRIADRLPLRPGRRRDLLDRRPGRRRRTPADRRQGLSSPKYSPDGRWIAYFDVPASLEARLYKVFWSRPREESRGRSSEISCSGPSFRGRGARLVARRKTPAVPGPAGRRSRSPRTGGLCRSTAASAVRTHAIENLALTTIVQYPCGWIGNSVYYVSGTTIEGDQPLPGRHRPERPGRSAGPPSASRPVRA